MAIHASALLATHTPFLPTRATVDVEYERVHDAYEAKRLQGHKVSPDLVVHRRGDTDANFLVVEVKNFRAVPRRAQKGELCVPDDWPKGVRLPDFDDLFKVEALVTGAPGSRFGPYEVGLCVELAGDGADLWWLNRAAGLTHEFWRPGVLPH